MRRLVNALAAAWGTVPVDDGKVVWFEGNFSEYEDWRRKEFGAEALLAMARASGVRVWSTLIGPVLRPCSTSFARFAGSSRCLSSPRFVACLWRS